VFSAKKERRYMKTDVKRKFAVSQEINIPPCGNENGIEFIQRKIFVFSSQLQFV
jgi:hypothetical protein